MGTSHRKQARHYEREGGCRELTFSCHQRMPFLVSNSWRELLSRCIDRACEQHRFQLAAFVYMPEHVHLLVWPLADASTIDRFLFAVKRSFANLVKRELEQTKSRLLERLTIRQRP